MTQHNSLVSCIAHSGMQSAAFENPRLSGITAPRIWARPVHRHLGRDYKGRRRVQESDAIGNGGHVPIRKRYQTSRRDEHLFSRRREPNDFPVERASLHVEPPVILQQLGMGQPKRLIVDEELDGLAVGHVEDGLSGFREPVGILGIDDGPGFIEAIDKRAVFCVGPPLFRAPAHADVAIAKRQHRFELRQEVGTKFFLDDVPFVSGVIPAWRAEAFMADHRAEPRGKSGQSSVDEQNSRGCAGVPASKSQLRHEAPRLSRSRLVFIHRRQSERRMGISPSGSHLGRDPNRLHQFLRAWRHNEGLLSCARGCNRGTELHALPQRQ